jgi:hypothetical protein
VREAESVVLEGLLEGALLRGGGGRAEGGEGGEGGGRHDGQ